MTCVSIETVVEKRGSLRSSAQFSRDFPEMPGDMSVAVAAYGNLGLALVLEASANRGTGNMQVGGTIWVKDMTEVRKSGDHWQNLGKDEEIKKEERISGKRGRRRTGLCFHRSQRSKGLQG